MQVWPIILSGHDLIGIAATGSGKTLGFGLPMLRHIRAQRDAGVVTGTRQVKGGRVPGQGGAGLKAGKSALDLVVCGAGVAGITTGCVWA